MKKFLITFWSTLVAVIIVIVLILVGTNYGLFGHMPDFEELENPKSAIASEIYSEDGVLLGKYYHQNRSNIAFADISSNVFEALIATEDIRFHEHSGIDFRGLARAILKLGRAGGASTISQQLAKNLFHDPDYSSKFKRIIQKVKEWVIAIKLERAYTKDEIITMYLNTVQFSGHSYGIKSVSHEFFNKTPAELTKEESAVLVGLLKAISRFNPRLNPENAFNRRNVVLNQMKRYDFITKHEYDSLKELPIVLDYKPDTHNEGLAPYFREYLKKELIPWCKERGLNLYKDGLKIHTTLNSRMQEHAENAVNKHIPVLQKEFYKSWGTRNPWTSENWHEIKEFPLKEAKKTERYRSYREEFEGDTGKIWKAMRTPVKMTLFTWENGEVDTLISPLDSVKHYLKFLQTGFIALDPGTGQVKAWVGGVNHKYFQYDHVNKKATRQVGSTFKPLFCAAALYLGEDPCMRLPREPTTFFLPNSKDWTPKNSDGSSGGTMNMYQGIANSDNLYMAQLMKRLGENGPRNVVDFVRRMGIDSARLQAVPSIALGVCDVSVMEMASAFAVFVNKGMWVEPTYLTRIEDKNGNTIAEFAPQDIRQIMTEDKAYAMFKMLEGGINHGTGARLRGSRYKVQGTIGGKTGTTQSNSDGWFMAVTKNLVTATWTGCESRAVRFRSTSLGQGANTALPIFGLFILDVLKDKELDIKLEPLDYPEPPYSLEWECGYREKKDEGTIKDNRDLGI